MSYKKFDSSKILKSENPFPSTRATSICNGTFIREIFGNYLFDIDVQTSVKCGLLKKLIEHYESSKESDGKYKPCRAGERTGFTSLGLYRRGRGLRVFLHGESFEFHA